MPPTPRLVLAGYLHRLGRALVGRACRYRLGRALFAPKAKDASVEPLGPLNMHVWEDYLHVPRGSLGAPSDHTYTAIAVSGGRVVGHVSVFKQWERHAVQVPGWWLTGLEVVPRWRGRAIGRRLVQSVIERWNEEEGGNDLYLVVNRRNSPAIALFASFGFRVFSHQDWEQRLIKVYGCHGSTAWAYQIMRREAQG